MIVMISKFKIHPFISIMLISLVLGIAAGIPIVDKVGKTERLFRVWPLSLARASPEPSHPSVS
jgi:hypothetical protein